MREEAPAADPLLERTAKYAQAFGEDERDEVADALAEARELVTEHLADAIKPAPEAVSNRAIVEVAAELFHRKGARNGVMDVAGGDLQPFRIARDPMKAAYPILAPYVVGMA